MSPQNEFPVVFEHLRKILKPFESKLTAKTDTPDNYYLEGPYSEKWKKELFFGAAQIKKNYVSFYLMPVYMYPNLLKGHQPGIEEAHAGQVLFQLQEGGTRPVQGTQRPRKGKLPMFPQRGIWKMKFKLELTIHKPRADVWKAFDNTENMKKWQPTLIKFEPVSGTPGQPGAVSTLTYEENGREFALTEKIIFRDEPNRFDGVYENEFANNPVMNTFIEQGPNETLWILETTYSFKTLAMKIAGPLMKKNFIRRTQKDMDRFKEMAEGL